MIRLDAPKVRINPYTNEQNNYSETVVKESNLNAKSLYTFMTAGIPDYSVDLSNENIDDYLNNKDSVNKLILFTDKEKTPLLFKGLSTHFYDRLSLGIVKSDKRDIFNRFQIEKLPVLLLYISAFDDVILQEPIIDIYKGETKAENIIYAVDFMAKKEKNYIKQRKELENEEVGTKIKADNFGIIELNPDNLEYFYTRSSGRAIFTIVGNKPLNENFNIPEGIKQIARETAGFVMFFYLNCSGQFEKNYVSKFLKDKSCPEEDKLKLWYIAPDKIKESINEIRELYEEINDLSYYFIEKMLIDLYEEKGSVVEIIDEEYHFMINKAKKENKTPLVFLHDQVRI